MTYALIWVIVAILWYTRMCESRFNENLAELQWIRRRNTDNKLEILRQLEAR
jgi:hypothetical protein